VEQVARASGNSFAITIFAIPFMGPFFGKAFMYLNEVPAFVRMGKDEMAGQYSFKQAPLDNDEWCEEGSQGLTVSGFLKVLYVFTILKYILLCLAVYFPNLIAVFAAIVYVMSLISGIFADKEKNKWKKRDELLDGARRMQVRRERIHAKKLMNERDQARFEAARRKWDQKHTKEEKEEKEKNLYVDKVQEFELKPLEIMTFKRTRVESCDNICRDVEKLMGSVVRLNSELRASTAEKRTKVQERTKELAAELRKKGEKHQARHPAVKGFVSVLMPSLEARYTEMLEDVPEVKEEHLKDAVCRKISQWRAFLVEDVDLSRLQQELGNILPTFNIEDVKSKVTNLELDVDVAQMKTFSFDVSACFKGQAAIIMQQEIDLMKEIIEMAADIFSKAFELLKQGKDILPKIPEALAQIVVETAKGAVDNVAVEAKQKVEKVKASCWAKKRAKNEEKEQVEEKKDYNNYNFMFPKDEMESRMKDIEHDVKEAFERIKTLCLNVLFILEAIQAACGEGQAQLQHAIASSSRLLGWIGVPPEFACVPPPPDPQDEMVMVTAEPTEMVMFTAEPTASEPPAAEPPAAEPTAAEPAAAIADSSSAVNETDTLRHSATPAEADEREPEMKETEAPEAEKTEEAPERKDAEKEDAETKEAEEGKKEEEQQTKEASESVDKDDKKEGEKKQE